jgi:type VI secretion system protein ImpM
MGMSTFAPSAVGYFGKLPARGDFVRGGLPEDFVAVWDGWCRGMLAASREMLGEGWKDAWMQAPVWQFLMPAGACGGRAALGVWLPGMDRVGRHFPFMVCALAAGVGELEAGGAWLDVAEAVAMSGVVEDAPHEGFAERLGAPVADTAVMGVGWWTAGSPLVQPRRFEIAGLPPASFAGAMLCDPVLTEPL